MCDKWFTEFGLKNHKVLHAAKVTYMCDVCDRVFAVKRNRDRHVVIHSDEKLFKCDDCGKAFYRKDYFKIHQCDKQWKESKIEAHLNLWADMVHALTKSEETSQDDFVQIKNIRLK